MDEKPVYWVGSSKQDFLAFPKQVTRDLGYALGVAQLGGKHPSAKPWKGEGPGVFEITHAWDGDAYRCVYYAKFADGIYVLHAFQKKSTTGIKTSKRDVDMVRQRFKRMMEKRSK